MMHRILTASVLFVSIGFISESQAIFGLGGHWAPAFGVSADADSGEVVQTGPGNVGLNNHGFSGLNGFGAKMWIDALPFIDIEVAGNIQFGTYSLDILTPASGGTTTTTPIKFDLGVPMLPTEPVFGRLYGDVAILYPFLKLPPLISIAKIYAGGGITYGAATAVLSPAFGKKAIQKAVDAKTFDPATVSSAELSKKVTDILVDAIKDEGLKMGAGGFVQLGAHVKPPVIPIAVYLDAKYHFLGFQPDEVSGSGFTLEMGGALAF